MYKVVLLALQTQLLLKHLWEEIANFLFTKMWTITFFLIFVNHLDIKNSLILNYNYSGFHTERGKNINSNFF